MNLKGQYRSPLQKRPAELGALAASPESTGERPALDISEEDFAEVVKDTAAVRDQLKLHSKNLSECVLLLDPLAAPIAGRLVDQLPRTPEVVKESGVPLDRLKGRLAQFHAYHRMGAVNGVFKASIADSQRVVATVTRGQGGRLLELLRPIVAADGPAALARLGIDCTEDDFLELKQWARVAIELSDSIAAERAAQSQKTKEANQKADEELKRAQERTDLVRHMIKTNSGAPIDEELAADTVRLYDRVHASTEKDRRGAGRQ